MTMVLVAMVGGGLGLTACKRRDKDAAKTTSTRIVDAAASGPTDARPMAAPGERTIGARVAAGDLRGAIPAVEYHLVFATEADALRGRAASARVAGDAATVTSKPLGDTAYNPDMLPYFGVDLGADDLARLASVTAAYTVIARSGDLARDLRVTTAAARAGAIEGHGWVVDPITAQTFSSASLDTWRPADSTLDAKRLIVIHAIREEDGGVFLDTVGLSRFGLPELCVRDVPHAFADEVMIAVNAAAQTLVERGALTRDGALAIDTAALTTTPWSDRHHALQAAGGTGTLTLEAFWSPGEHDDVPMIELRAGASPEAMMTAVRGFAGGEEKKESMQYATDDKEAALAAARKRALAELAVLAPRFARGVPDLEHLEVKAPFATDSGGNEWMWVEVHEWKGTRLRGILVNRPFDVAALKEGAAVEVQQAELFDYIHRRADGTTVGGETIKILAGE